MCFIVWKFGFGRALEIFLECFVRALLTPVMQCYRTKFWLYMGLNWLFLVKRDISMPLFLVIQFPIFLVILLLSFHT